MNSDRLITVAIHTYEKALALKGTLEREGIIAVLNNVNLTQPTISSGVRVRIAEKDLPLALRIIENPDIFNRDSHSFESQPTIIVPTDFSDYSYRACLMAFDIARLYKANIIILHSYLRADAIEKLNSYDTDSESFYSEFDDELEVANKMSEFSQKIVEQIKFGLIPPIKFSTKIVEGVPENAIEEFAKSIQPQIIVMGTRGAGKKEKELIGSVTGEVLDACRFPVFAVPESANIFDINTIKHIAFFCNNEHEDIVALDTMYRLLPNISAQITLINIPRKVANVVDSFVSSDKDLVAYCRENYPRFEFSLQSISPKKKKKKFNEIEYENHIDLIVVPNKRKNVFSRFFNPTLAHKILLHADIPMMTIPI